ncbi:MAG: Ulp1 protease [Barrevirus sp.]|uniref:Ulp1 protease n=1 Tax=Barrevirus sp. TaxID=2487763 RepID=A0A3G4ZPW7_9VIRU|nr:MAG: Ulp1 protease [Barrevirus sp.]
MASQDNDDLTFVTITSEDLRPASDKDYKCAPAKKFEDWSCIPLESLMAMADAFNEENSGKNNQIRVDHKYKDLEPDRYKRYLLKQFKIKFKKCKDQICWTKQSFMKRLNDLIKDDLENNTWLPEGPSKGNKWLDSKNIRSSLKQKEYVYNDFKSFGALPYDFSDLDLYGLKDIDFKKDLIDKGKTKIGMVINLDRHNEPGSHWTALYADFSQGECYFFDSYGYEPDFGEKEVENKEITKFMKRISDFIKNDLGKEPIVDYNKKRHQRGGSECGVYSLSFINRLLKGDKFADINGQRVTDEEVNKCRDYYFA